MDQVIEGPQWRIQVLGDALVRFEWDPDGVFVDGETQVVIDRPFTDVAVTVDRRGDGVQVITRDFQLDYDGAAPSASGLQVKGRGNYHAVWRYGEPFENAFAGLFARPLNLGGTTRTLDTIDGRTELDDGVLSTLGIATLDDSRSFGVDGTDLTPPREGHVDVYVFTHGSAHEAALEDLAKLTGRTPLIPRYALGNWWSRYHRYSAEEYAELMDRFDDERLPFSVAVIDMDWHITDLDPKYGHGWTGYSWNRELFPDPEAFMRDLHDRGMAITLNVHPADGIRAFEDAYPKVMELMGRDPDSGLPADFDLTDPSFVRAYFEGVHHPLEEQGVDFWWLDWQQGSTSASGVDPLWLLNHLHVEDMRARGKRPLILSRYAGPGSHRHPVGFSGDTVTTWASLEFQPEFTATAANIGYGTWSHDIGGHVIGVRDDELGLRWLQFGVFSPINRLHSSNDPFAGKEPWKYRREIEEIMGDFLRLRHALVPYLYTEWAIGKPLCRPMYHSHPHDLAAYEVPNQYWFGREMIVAPITSPVDAETRMGAVQVWLPEGHWTDIFTGVRYSGNRLLTMHRDLTSIPVLARDGAVIPTAEFGTAAGELPEALEVLVVPGADGEYVLVEDDGGLEPRSVTTRLRWDDAESQLIVEDPEGAVDLIPTNRRFDVTILGSDESAVQRCETILEAAQTASMHKNMSMAIIEREPTPLRAMQALKETPIRGAVVGAVTHLSDGLISALTEMLTAEA